MPTILVADDDYSIRTVIQQALVRENYHVCLAADASELWEFVQKGEGDLVITDIAMPDMNGFDLLPKIKKIRPTLQVIVRLFDKPYNKSFLIIQKPKSKIQKK